MAGTDRRLTWTIRRPLQIGLVTVLALLGAFGVWASVTQIAGAVIGSGMIEVQSTRTAVQHPLGGVVVEVLKQDGDRVVAGEVILRLDDRPLRSGLVVTEGALFETLANVARLEAALEGRQDMVLHPLLADAAGASDEVQALVTRLQAQLAAHFAGIDTALRLLDEQVAQSEAQIAGVEAQLTAKQQELGVLAIELARARDLSASGLIRSAEVLTLEKADIAALGEVGRLTAQIAELRGRIAEAALKRLAVHTDATALIGVELSRLRPERTRLLEARTGLLDQLAQLEIRAPVSGQIIESMVYGAQSVVVAASPLMMIVPADQPVRARVRVAATDIDQIFVGQQASLRFQSFDGRQMPVTLGEIWQVSADAFLDPRSQLTYYEVVVAVDAADLTGLGGKDLIPGMPVEAYFATETRTPISYITRPVMVYLDRAFRDT